MGNYRLTDQIRPELYSRPPSIRLFNVKYSPNLGDGLLSECLERALVDLGAAASTKSIDLAARLEYGDSMAGRDIVMKALEATPKSLRRLIVRAPLAVAAYRKWRPHFSKAVAGADGVVIGGGNLISDIDLNFPTKLGLAMEEAERAGLPVIIYACGMAEEWSSTGLRWCRRAFAKSNLRAVFVRDADSKALWDELMAPHTGLAAEVVRDPGLLAADFFPPNPRIVRDRPIVGLGIMSHIAIRYHSRNAPSRRQLDDWYVALTRQLISMGFNVRVFTNGSPEDRTYAADLAPRLRALRNSDNIAFVKQKDPAGLCAHIQDVDAVVAFRMHAVIAAYAYGVPAVALAWDRKLASFMTSIGRDKFLLDVTETTPEACAALVRRVALEGVPEVERRAVVSEARADIARLWSFFRPEASKQ